MKKFILKMLNSTYSNQVVLKAELSRYKDTLIRPKMDKKISDIKTKRGPPYSSHHQESL